MNIAVLTRACYPLHGFGGLERHAFDLVRHLMDREVHVTLVTPPERRARAVTPGSADATRPAGEAARLVLDDPRCTRHVVPYLTFPFAGRRGTTVIDRSTAYPLFGYRAGRLAARLVAEGTVDLVYGLGASSLGYASARAHGAAAPFVFNPQGLEEFGATDPTHGGASLKRTAYAPLRLAVRACARAADRVIATDSVLEPVVVRHLRVDPDRVAVVPNAIDIDACDRLAGPDAGRRLRARQAIADDEAVLLSVGRLEANKGFDVLAKALSQLAAAETTERSRRARWRWVLVGDGPYRRAIEGAIAAGGLGGRTLLAGRVAEADLHAWYEAATLFVHPTLYEGSSLVTLEAMAHGRAVVATNAGGLPDKVRPGTSGWIVPPGDAGALAAAIREALDARDRLATMGAEGRAIVLARFSWAHVIEMLLAVFADVLRHGDRQAPGFSLPKHPRLPY